MNVNGSIRVQSAIHLHAMGAADHASCVNRFTVKNVIHLSGAIHAIDTCVKIASYSWDVRIMRNAFRGVA